MDISSNPGEKKILELLVASSEEFLQFAGTQLDYQKIIDTVLKISGAKYAGFNLYDEDGSKFRTVAFSAPEGIIKKVSTLLGFGLIGKAWEHDSVRAEKIKSFTITHFSSLRELTGDVIPKKIVSLLEKTFDTGEVVLVKILKENVMLGDFTLIMPSNVKLKNDNYVELYTRQLGLLITRRRGEIKLIESQIQLKSIFAALSDPLFILDQKTVDILEVNDSACRLYGYSRDEMLKLKATDMYAEPEKTREAISKIEGSIPVRYHKKKDGTVFVVEITANQFDLNGRNVLATSIRDITERKKAEEEIKSLAKFPEENPNLIGRMGYDGKLLYCNPAYKRILNDYNQITVNLQDSIKKITAEKIFNQENVEIEIGNLIFLFNLVPIKEENYIIFHGKDITDQRRAEEVMRQSAERHSIILKTAMNGFWLTDMQGRLLEVNDTYCRMSGYSTQELLAMSIPDLEAAETNNDTAAHIQKIIEQGEDRFESRHQRKDGSIYGVEVSVQYQTAEGGRFVVFLQDITQRKKAEEAIIHLSFHDHLTGLYNRRFFEEELKRLDTARQLPLSFIMGDLNSLKIINDVFGHIAGDELLKETSEILKKVCRSEDILARWGGDEFVILLPKTTPTDAEEIVQRIKKECEKTNIKKIQLSLSLGAAVKETAAQDIQTIVIDAESNMYKNKLAQKESLTSSIVFALDTALHEKSNETKEHTDRLKELAIKLGKSIKLASSQLDELSLLASLHDIGKVAIPETILNKEAAKLTKQEWDIIKKHPGIGFNIAQSSPQISHIAKPILSCHENFDGSGYPLGLKGEEIRVLSASVHGLNPKLC